jgi:hypothetical protein
LQVFKLLEELLAGQGRRLNLKREVEALCKIQEEGSSAQSSLPEADPRMGGRFQIL